MCKVNTAFSNVFNWSVTVNSSKNKKIYIELYSFLTWDLPKKTSYFVHLKMQDKMRLLTCFDPSDSDVDSREEDESQQLASRMIVTSWLNFFDQCGCGND